MTIETVGVVGAGAMGNGIAQTFAMAGFPVVMQDLSDAALARGRATIEKSLERLVKRDKIATDAAEAALGRLETATDPGALAGRDLVVEAIVEKFEVKAGLLGKLDDICGEATIFATNTSSISLTRLAAASSRPGRVIGMHFFNPVPLMQLVEIIRALQTEDAVCDAITELTRAVGKTPRVSKDSYGFVVNRVLAPMINEAINCVYEGLASPEDVDEMMKLGANHPMGPLSLGDLIGLDVVLNIMETLYGGFDDPKYRPSPLLKQMVDAGYLGRKSGRGFFRYG
ncbi:3-hydroxybutyryl-CoA dehydrogenase [Rubrimonas cliftonensis]|uniref:3-hydroxyacyl-CoA dehydrogenase n=1 Tax=Rubrimonas cliftonensis TaxID=89524 RepID=A0A1H4G1A2_9RHOB|nr:3-hydroxybutyryl-CoA dehydrogenase [Rubrimonas cliftonensis]SEB03345.1 3-hydroxyacyl-CoA dehydrogenase [Rubrimonas cliftonensis]